MFYIKPALQELNLQKKCLTCKNVSNINRSRSYDANKLLSKKTKLLCHFHHYNIEIFL